MPTEEKPLRSDLVSDKQRLNQRFGELEREYNASFKDHYKELGEFLEPRRGRFFLQDHNRGEKRHKNIINNHGTIALRRATSGLLAGAMSPSRPWFAWDIKDKELKARPGVKAWLRLYRDIVLMVFNASNLYQMAPQMLKEILLFGTGCMTQDDDFYDVARFYTHTVGSYRIDQNDRQIVDTLGREFQMTTRQMVRKFGLERVSSGVRDSYNRGNYNGWHTVRHMIEPNPFRDRDMAIVSAEFLPFRSVYWETSNKADKDAFLRRSGSRGFSAYVPRWETTNEDVPGTNCPGMETLGDVKQLQVQEKELAKAQAKGITPPLQGPPSYQNRPISQLPGGVNLGTTSNAKLEPVYQIDPREQGMLAGIARTERRIDVGFLVDLFLAITEIEGIQPKNQLQLSQVNEERLLQIGPALQQVHGEWLERMVGRTANRVLDVGIMPPPPPELEGRELEIEFTSALAQAQRSVATAAIERTVGFAGVLAEGGWPAQDKIDADRALDEYGELVGVPPEIIVPTEEARRVREERAQREAQEQALAQAQMAANVVKMASDAKLDDDSVASRTAARVGA